ncbi:MAG: tyrosine-type recombinase/integrase [Aureispira sp.]|nr:tyrosine-type recombinase/integrase [Aureispira sp.]
MNISIQLEYTSKRRCIPKKKPIKLNIKYPDELIKLEEKLMLHRYSINTIKSYKSCFRKFLVYCKARHPKDVSFKDTRQFLLKHIRSHNLSSSMQNQLVNAIKFYYESVLGRDRVTYNLERPKARKKLPYVLTEDEVSTLLSSVDNLKHRCILFTIYSAGLRLSEVTNLQLTDIMSNQQCIFVRDAKGTKDRYTLLSNKLLHYLRQYYKEYRPNYWLFEGMYGGAYSKRAVQNVLKKALINSRIKKPVTVHTLRHSFATHLLERGVDLRYIQHLLGHNSSKTTEIYTHISMQKMVKLSSPLDFLSL